MSIDIKLKLMNAIKEARKEKCITQTKLAKSIGMSTSFICDIESGRKNPSIGTLILIAKNLNLSLDKIFLN